MAYPIESLTPTSTDAEKEKALMETVQQMVSEGIPEEQAMQQVQQMMMSMQTSSVPTPMAQNLTSGGFMRSGSMTGNGGLTGNYEEVPNPSLKNFKPAIYPKGSR
jgi:hypothetical protein